MLLVLASLKLACEIALMALAGQGTLHVLAGNRRRDNVFYLVLRGVARPFTAVVERVLPAGRVQRLAPAVAFALLAVAWLALTAAKIAHCLANGMAGCR